MLMNSIKNVFRKGVIRLTQSFYRKIYIPLKAIEVRNKKNIRVLFPLGNLGAWKTESLYVAMLAHPRFKPILLIGKSGEDDDRENLIRYCKFKKYQYKICEDLESPMWKSFSPDIIFYQKPYSTCFLNNLRSLFCYVPYAFRNSTEDWAFKAPLLYNAWQIYYENTTLRNYYSISMKGRVQNGFATGIPPMDDLIIPTKDLKDPWKGNSKKIRIIYAPHHSINPENWWQTSTFLETGELMLDLAERYSDRIQWAFKPHPLLRYKLEKIWGKEKTDSYYDKWANSEWSQYESGKYLGLFKHSDAMIHDCGSFVEEYLCSGNPVMYLVRPGGIEQNWNEIYKKAFDLHYKGSTINDIEQFIKNVLEGSDNLKSQRESFYAEHLTPPFGKSACDNIIDCILDRKKARKFKK
jgi:hypothetical protein